MTEKPVIVALDFATSAAALALAARLDPALCRVKVGKELFTTAGPQVVEALMKMGFDVFLDLKFHDIPNTVAGACKAAARQGVWMVNVHAAGGTRMLEAAADAVKAGEPGARRPLLIGVTVLTSMGVEELPEIGLHADMQQAVHRYAALCRDAGLDGVVCSAQEASGLKAAFGADFKLVTPGIRLAGDAKGDQTRVVTPTEAIKMGSDYLVIGRSVTGADDPVAVLTKINESLKVTHA
jgi:orotidine-5'-phosphate decarboxylase